MKKKLLFGMVLLLGTLVNAYAADPLVDPHSYASRLGYKFQNNWIYSKTLGNYTLLGAATKVRGMAVKDGKMLFCSRDGGNKILVVDGATGALLTPVTLASNVFTYNDNGTSKPASANPCNDIQVDAAGNVLVCNLANVAGTHFQIWKIDMATGNGTLVVDYVIPASAPRYDYFGISGSVDGNAIIMSGQDKTLNVDKWEIIGGILTSSTPATIVVDNATPGRTLTGVTHLGGSPRVYPYPDYFYVDGNDFVTPRIGYTNGKEIDGFWNNTRNGLVDSTTVPGSKITMDGGNNGLKEFSVGSDNFIIMSPTNHTNASFPTTFRIYKFADANKSYANMDCMWTFPAAGMGNTAQSYRSSVPDVEVSGDKAYIYVYAGENGYAKYTMQVDPSSTVNVPISTVDIRWQDGKIYLSEQVKSVEIFSIGGQRMDLVRNVSEMPAPAQKGLYIVNVTDKNGAHKVQKIVVF